MNSNLLPVLKEGFRPIAYAFSAFIVLMVLDFDLLSLLAFALSVFYIYVYRNPERLVPYYEKDALVTPVDGVVALIEELEDSEYAYKVTIESDYSNVSVLRIPLKGKVTSVTSTHGARVGQLSPLFKKINENCSYIINASEKKFVNVVHRTKQSVDQVHCELKVDTNTMLGHRYGVMINGVTELYIPSNFRLNVDVGMQVEASNTLLGYFS